MSRQTRLRDCRVGTRCKLNNNRVVEIRRHAGDNAWVRFVKDDGALDLGPNGITWMSGNETVTEVV